MVGYSLMVFTESVGAINQALPVTHTILEFGRDYYEAEQAFTSLHNSLRGATNSTSKVLQVVRLYAERSLK